MKSSTSDWLETAELDLEAIQQIIKHERLTGHVAFLSQQAIEKALKAIVEESGERVPRVHSLSKLFEQCSQLLPLPFNDDLILALDSLYIESRFPSELGLLPNGKPNLHQAEEF